MAADLAVLRWRIQRFCVVVVDGGLGVVVVVLEDLRCSQDLVAFFLSFSWFSWHGSGVVLCFFGLLKQEGWL
jgi:hypothetical protein